MLRVLSDEELKESPMPAMSSTYTGRRRENFPLRLPNRQRLHRNSLKYFKDHQVFPDSSIGCPTLN